MNAADEGGGGLFAGLGARIGAEETKSPKPVMNMMALLELPSEQRTLVRHLLRAGEPLDAARCAADLGVDPTEMAATVKQLTMIGLVEDTPRGLRAVAGWRASRLPPGGIWSRLADL